MSISEPSALSLGPSVFACLLILRPWLGLLLARESGRPDMVVPLATQELGLTHRELSKEAGFKFSVGRRRNITHKRSFKDHGGNVTLTHAGALDPAGDTASAHTHVCPGSPKPQSLQADRRAIQLQGRKGRNETSRRQGRNGTDWRKGLRNIFKRK